MVDSTASAPRPLGWGLIGTGGICGQMADALSHVGDARLVAVGSRDMSRAQAFLDERRLAHPRARAHGDYAALVQDPEVDVVYIGTPNPDHVQSMRLAIAAGKAVLCEKPFTLNRHEAEEAVALARERGTFLMEAMWTRLLPAVVEAKRLVDSGAIGRPLSVLADFGFAAHELPATHRVFDPALGGGALLDIGIYPLSFAAFVLGPLAEVQVAGDRGPTGVDVHLAFQARHAGGGISQGLCSLLATTAQGAKILGTKGRIELEPPFYGAQTLRLVTNGEGFGGVAGDETITRPYRGNGFVPQVEEVHRCLRAGLRESPAMPLDESVTLVGWMDEMRRRVGVRYPGEVA